MSRCLKERALVRMYLREGTAAERAHLRFCADCAEHYDLVVENMQTIGQVLDAPPPAVEIRYAVPWRLPLLPMAGASLALIALLVGGTWLRRPAPVRVATGAHNVSAFAADLGAALFPPDDANAVVQLAAEEPDLDAALEAGQPCTRDRFFSGECNDQLSAFAVESE